MSQDAYTAYAEQAGREDLVCFQTVIERVNALPVTTDAEKTIRDMLSDKLAFAVTRLKPDTRQMIAEDMDEILNKLETHEEPMKTIKCVEAEYIESGTFQGGECDVSAANIKYDAECVVMKKTDFVALQAELKERSDSMRLQIVEG